MNFTDPVSFLFEDAGDSIFRIEGTGLAALAFDTVDDETHRWTNRITQFPTEGRVDISDNIGENTDELSITAFISNTPIHALVDEVMNFADRFLNGRKRTQEAFNQLLALKKQRTPMTVTTRYRVYENMGLEDVTIRRTPDIGDALVVELSFKQINIVKTTTGTVPAGIGRPGAQSDNATKTRAGSKVDAGKSTGKVVTEPTEAPRPVQKQRSVLRAIMQ
ncbi:phage baseplate protein [Citrobacter amalonaticus]|uniref:Dit-like phage tail protein N-terminal domain-containing protein n=1 Tax=Citrobacter amalonaticus TaxID=35703 RepID=A0AAX2BP36_CITAM|nr:hypothetical protein [Citrobacter amalonaticus]SBA20801.1 conserved protein of unknown function [Citrobacter amalonaticus]